MDDVSSKIRQFEFETIGMIPLLCSSVEVNPLIQAIIYKIWNFVYLVALQGWGWIHIHKSMLQNTAPLLLVVIQSYLPFFTS